MILNKEEIKKTQWIYRFLPYSKYSKEIIYIYDYFLYKRNIKNNSKWKTFSNIILDSYGEIKYFLLLRINLWIIDNLINPKWIWIHIFKNIFNSVWS